MKEGEGEKESISYEEMVSHEWLLPAVAPQLRAIVPVKPSQATELDPFRNSCYNWGAQTA